MTQRDTNTHKGSGGKGTEHKIIMKQNNKDIAVMFFFTIDSFFFSFCVPPYEGVAYVTVFLILPPLGQPRTFRLRGYKINA